MICDRCKKDRTLIQHGETRLCLRCWERSGSQWRRLSLKEAAITELMQAIGRYLSTLKTVVSRDEKEGNDASNTSER